MSPAAHLRRLRADLIVERLYDAERALRPYDTTQGRRHRALERLQRRVDELVAQSGHAGPMPTSDDVEGALRRACDRRITREVSDAVLVSLERVRRELERSQTNGHELARPARLQRALDGDGSIFVYGAGASRRRS